MSEDVMRKTVSRYLSLLLLAVIASSPLACATKEKEKPKTAQQLKEEAELAVKMEAMAKVVMDYLATPEKQDKQYVAFIGKMIERAKGSNTEATEVPVAFSCAGEIHYGHYNLTTKTLTMGDSVPQLMFTRIYLSLADIRFIKCAVNSKRIDLSATKSANGEYTLKPIGAWDID